MHRINIKKKSKRFEIKSSWKFASKDGWEYYIVSFDGLKLITKPDWGFYIVFYGELMPFELDKDRDHLRYFYAKDYTWSPQVQISHQDANGWIHIKTEAGTFKWRWLTKR